MLKEEHGLVSVSVRSPDLSTSTVLAVETHKAEEGASARSSPEERHLLRQLITEAIRSEKMSLKG